MGLLLIQPEKYLFLRYDPFIFMFPKTSWLYTIMTWKLNDTYWLLQLLLSQSLMLFAPAAEKGKI